MKKIFIPPVFVFLGLVLIICCSYLMPSFNLIPFPLNLIGLAAVFWGISINGKAKDLFKTCNTPHTFDEPVHLIEQGISADRLEAQGFGEEKPIAPNNTRRGRAQNRRVEFLIVEQ